MCSWCFWTFQTNMCKRISMIANFSFTLGILQNESAILFNIWLWYSTLLQISIITNRTSRSVLTFSSCQLCYIIIIMYTYLHDKNLLLYLQNKKKNASFICTIFIPYVVVVKIHFLMVHGQWMNVNRAFASNAQCTYSGLHKHSEGGFSTRGLFSWQ